MTYEETTAVRRTVNWDVDNAVHIAVGLAVGRDVYNAVEMVMFRIAYWNLNMDAGNAVGDAVSNELENIKGETR